MRVFSGDRVASREDDISKEATRIVVKVLKDSKAFVSVSSNVSPLELRVSTVLTDLSGLEPDIRFNVDKGVLTVRKIDFRGSKFPTASDLREFGIRLYNLEQAFVSNLE